MGRIHFKRCAKRSKEVLPIGRPDGIPRVCFDKVSPRCSNISKELLDVIKNMPVIDVDTKKKKARAIKTKDLKRLQLALQYYAVEKESDWERIALSMNRVFDSATCKRVAIEHLDWAYSEIVTANSEFSWEDLSSTPGTLEYLKTFDRLSRNYILTGGCDDYFTGERRIIEDPKDIYNMYDLNDSLVDILLPPNKKNFSTLNTSKLSIVNGPDHEFDGSQLLERTQSYPELASPAVMSDKKRISLIWRHQKRRNRSVSESLSSVQISL
ncbi:unnamed protein product, partial [Mesorhabditis belari]|uniref:Uncharacterized protein n=1 Tax=Mesorhabditis belari TaxID=2138241 RepID=A0AAF3FC81_9BILA